MMSSLNLTWGQRLRRSRAVADLSQAELAARLGVSRQTVSGWENGAEPSAENLEALAAVLPDMADRMSPASQLGARFEDGTSTITSADSDGVLYAVAAMQRTLADLIHAAQAARDHDRERRAIGRLIPLAEDAMPPAPESPQASAPQARRRAGE